MNRDTFADIQPTRAIVYVANKKLNFVSLRLEQAFGEHHSFVIKADFDALGQAFMNNPIEQLRLIGQTVDMDVQQGADNAKAYMFRGIIQKVSVQGWEGKNGYLVISGSSPTILMEKGKRCDVFTNLTLKQVVDQLTEDIINQKESLPVVNNPVYTGNVDFLMQYRESDWQFLRRLSSIAKENMYWTGRDLVFGMHDDFPTLEVTYDREITSYEFSFRLLPNNFTRYQYLPEKDEILTKDAPDRIKGANRYVNSAHDEGKIVTEKRPVKTPLDMNVFDVGSLNDMVEREKIGRATETVVIAGTSKTAHPRIGRLLKIKMPDTMKGSAELGTFRITKVVHEFTQNDRYECRFEGIPADLKHYPLLDVEIPVAVSEPGTVISNADPDGQGRVRVEFPFAEDRVSDTWFRVLSPNAGLTSDKKKNRGMVFIPEPNDQVMMCFERGDPNRPYVTGSTFHGKSGMGGGENNAIKSITLRCGTKIVFNDDEGSVHVEVPSGSTYDMDGKGNVAVYAPNKLTLTAKDIEINADNDVSFITGNNRVDTVGANYDITIDKDKFETVNGASNYYLQKEIKDVKSDVICKVGGNISVAGDGDVKIKSSSLEVKVTDADTLIESTGKITLNSGDIVQIAE